MHTSLEAVNKSLEEHLETKRHAFPRLYFLPDDDLLDILAQAKDPTNIQHHLQKCFEGARLIPR
jgi:dynein heavy chain, axonemal